jgi:hypothetical protein
MAWLGEHAFRSCPHCGVTNAQFKLVGNAQPDKASGGKRELTFLACPRCAGPVVIETPTGSGNAVVAVWPDLDASFHKIADVPSDVYRHYEEAQKALRADLPDLAAVALRRCVEAASAEFLEFGRVDKNVWEGINRLVDAGYLTSQFGEASHHVRKLGNIGAHASDTRLTEAEVKTSFDFTTQMLRNLFEIPAALARILENGGAEG